ncbi:CFEM domain-containing protein [Phanerochaete sordida]|uniref:CFEM domain-containing protein n=1 Tax=Phanerochaete sordida TaxID=48140 RepID=A0A9P3G2A0_9APHY|nr:CFEM domain-containing protein [Phanerochaete sordida]
MRFSLAALLFAGVLSANAASLRARQSFPDCANTCVLNPPSTFGCDAADDGCLCRSDQYVASTTQCIVQACDAADAASAEALSRQLCAEVGVTLTATPSFTSSGSSTASSTGAASTPTGAGSSTSAPAPSSQSSSSTSSGAAPTQTGNGAASSGINVALGAAAAAVAAVFAL